MRRTRADMARVFLSAGTQLSVRWNRSNGNLSCQKMEGTMEIAKIGFFSSIASIVFWVVLNFSNPYTGEHVGNNVLFNTLLTLLAPACAALFASVIAKPSLMFIAFVWSLPISLYVTMTPSIFRLFGVTSVLYLISGILTIVKRKYKTGT